MIIGHEGLPGSGKSYEFLVEHVIPSVKKGRKVFAYVEGINHEKIAQICDITVEKCKELIIQLTAEQVPDIYNHVEPNSIVGIDELQNFFPNHKSKLDEKMTKFIAEHRHYGLDIIVMGQNLKDTHSVWRRRIERKIIFYKMSALGKDNKYQWTAYQAVPQADRDPQYVKSASGFRNYEEKYFGSYASHTTETTNTEHYKDGRFNVWNRKSIRYGLPMSIALGVAGCWYISTYFTDPGKIVKSHESAPAQQSAPVGHSSTNTSVPQQPAKPVAVDLTDPTSFRPKFMGHPETAPAYRDKLVVTSIPRVSGYIADAEHCIAFTEQGTRVDMTDGECRRRMDNPAYNPYKTANNVPTNYFTSKVPSDASGKS